MELWLIAIGALAIGSVIGVAVSGKLGNSNPARINELETQLEASEHKHDSYRDSVSDHFNTTAELVQQMTESYRDVYQHLAHGAQDLCTKEVAGKMLPAGEDRLFLNKQPTGSISEPPKDYAANKEPGKAGALSEEFGLEKPQQDDTAAESSNKD